jgi:hypothetical protein
VQVEPLPWCGSAADLYRMKGVEQFIWENQEVSSVHCVAM